MTRREFLKRVYKVGGFSALVSLGLTKLEIESIAGQGMGPGPGVKGYSTGKASYSDAFSGDLSAWTDVTTSWSISGGELVAAAGGPNVIAYNSPTNTTSQYIENKVINPAAGAGENFWWIFWAVSSFDSGASLKYDGNAGTVTLYNADTSAVGTALSSFNMTDGHYYGVEVSGATNNATVSFYDNGTSSATRPWSSPLKTWSGVDLTATGTYGKYFIFEVEHAAGSTFKIDDFKFGDQ